MKLKMNGFGVVIVVIQAVMMIVMCSSLQYKVGDLDSWGIPTATSPDVYTKWSKHHIFTLGDSLLFLYPPSQDSLIQVTPQAFKSCNLKDPILFMNDGNTVFNITQAGEFYFTSGETGHCQKGQKLHISLSGKGAIAYPPSQDENANAPSYQNVFGSIPTPKAASPDRFSSFLASLLALALSLWVTSASQILQ